MAHLIDETTGRASCMVVGAPAWHRLGVVLNEAPTSAMAMKQAGLDWRVEEWPVRAFDAETDRSIHCPNTKAIVRSDTKAVLGIHSERYQPLQNCDAFRFMDALVESGEVKYESAGALKGGRVVWMLARIPTEIEVGGGDVTHPYVLLSNSHDGSQAIRIYPTAVRVVCNNTLRLSTNSTGADLGINVMHLGDLDEKINEARYALGLMRRQLEQYGELASVMAARKMTSGEAKAFFESLFPVAAGATDRAKKSAADRVGRVSDLYYWGQRNNLPGMERSVWAALNAVTEWADHEQRATGETEEERLDHKVQSMWFGTAHRLKTEAYEKAMALVK